jgi:hypothetical protein
VATATFAPGSVKIVDTLPRPTDAYAESSRAADPSAVVNAWTWIDWNAAGSIAETGVGPADPAMPGNAARARAAVSAAPATILEGRTIGAHYRIRGSPTQPRPLRGAVRISG